MAEAHVISALRAKRAELAGLILQLERDAAQRRADLAHVDGAIRLFAPTIEPETIGPKVIRQRNRWFVKRRGELARRILGVLRRSGGPLAAVGIAGALMEAKGLDVGDRVMLVLVQKLVHRAIRHMNGAALCTRPDETVGLCFGNWPSDQAAGRPRCQ